MIHKILNLQKVLASYSFSRITKNPAHHGLPFSLSIEPTNLCNLHCPECPTGMGTLTREKGFMDFPFYKRIIDQLHHSLFYINLHFQGEPYLHSRFTDMVSYAKAKKICVSTSTNGHFLNTENIVKTIESGLDRLIISLDGTDQEAYSQYRKGGDFDRVVEGIKELVRVKQEHHVKKPRIMLQFLVLKSNQHQIKEIRKLSKQLGVEKLELKTAQFYDFMNGNPLMPDLPEYCRYKKSNSSADKEITYKIRNKLPDHCFRMWSSCVITWDGWVVPCCFDKDATLRMGNLNKQSFSEIWKNEAYQAFRKKILTSRKEIPICTNCTEGTGLRAFI